MVKRLLAIEDDYLHHMIIGKIAGNAGYEASIATSVEKATALLHEGTFDCITLDLSLGDRSGVDVLHVLADLGTQVPIIIFSGTDDADCQSTVGTGKRLGLNIWQPLAKPAGVVELRKVLDSISATADS
jgi:two-component system, chemotaxis family, chemotaxis protein CheY